MVNVMNFLKEIETGDELFEAMKLGDEQRGKAKIAYDKGVECILNTQIIVDGKPTVWCAQHDEFTLAPAMARSYELESFSGKESARIVLLLMSLENPSPEIIAAVMVLWNGLKSMQSKELEWSNFEMKREKKTRK